MGKHSFAFNTDKATGRILIERPGLRWKHNIRMNFKEIDFSIEIGLIRLRVEIIEESL